MAFEVGGIYYTVSADTKPLVDQARVVDRETQRMAASFNAITAAIKVLAAAMALVKAAQLADDMRLLASRVQVAAGSVEAGAAALDELRKISARTQTELAANVAVFNRLNSSIRQMGGTQQDTLRITELLGKAIKVSGASGAEAASAMTQFGQALGSGKLAGDELRSLLENAPYLMQQLATGLGVPIGALKQLDEEGKLTSDVVVNALGKAAAQIEADFAKLPQTVSGAFTLASDAAKAFNEQLDTATGSSAALSGAAKGLADVLNQLAQQFAETNKQSEGLSRSEQVRTWATATREALSFVADAADVTWQTLSVLGRNVAFVFEMAGKEIGGISAQVAAVLRGDLAGARAIGAAMREESARARAELDASDAKTLANRKTWGQRMREEWEQGAREDRGFTPAAAGSGNALKPPGTPGAADKFDDAKYLAKLREEVASEYERIGTVEEEALRMNAERLRKGEITQRTAAEAEQLIRDKSLQDRLAYAEKVRAQIEKEGEDEAKAAQRAQQQRAQGQGFARGVIGQGDELLRLQQELEAKKAMLAEYAAADMANEQLYAEARVALEQQTQARIAEIVAKRQQDSLAAQSAMLQNYGAVFGSLADMTKTFAGEQSSAYKAMFAVSKAFAIADSIIKIQQGIAGAFASGATWQEKIAGAASVAAAAANIVSTIQGVQFGGGRMYGGPTDAGSLYQVNEMGRPELFRGADGSQYMLPTQRGSVVPADQLGGGGWNVVVNNYAGADVSVQQTSDNTIEIAVNRAEARVAAGISERSGPVWSALRSSTNVQSRL